MEPAISSTLSRREFVQRVGVGAAGLLLAGDLYAQNLIPASTDKLGPVLPKRRLGKTELQTTIYCLGGFHLFRSNEQDARAIVDRSFERGIRFFETAYGYGSGKAEKLMGRCLESTERDDYVLMSKSHMKNVRELEETFEGSLRNLKTDYIDIYLIHNVKNPEDVDERLEGGVLERLIRYQQEGKLGHIGFSGHYHYSAHLHLLAKQLGAISVCLMPINVADPSYNSFIDNVMPELIKQDVGILAMKTLGGGGLLGAGMKGRNENNLKVIPNKIQIPQALQFALSCPVGAIVNGVESLSELNTNLDAVWDHKPMDAEERAALVALCAEEGKTGILEDFKKQRRS